MVQTMLGGRSRTGFWTGAVTAVLTAGLCAGCSVAAPVAEPSAGSSTAASPTNPGSTADPIGSADPSASSSADPALAGQVQEIADSLVEAGAPAVVVDIRTADGAAISSASGKASLESGEPAMASSPLRIASVSKAMLATVVMQLVEEGKFTLDATVDELLPGAIEPPAPVTVTQLLNHTSGLPDYVDVLVTDASEVIANADTSYTSEQLIDAAQKKPWVGEPGGNFMYSNTNYTVLGEIVEKVTGNTVAEEMTKRIFEPLKLAETTYPSDETMPAGSLSGYLRRGGELVDVTEYDPSLWSHGASVISTAPDVSTFFQALWGGDLLSAASVKAMQDVGVEGYGLGVLVGGDACGAAPPEQVFGQRGNGFGYRTISLASPTGERVATIAWTATAVTAQEDPLLEPGSAALTELLGLMCPR